jgi:hypothetical protein
MTRPSLLVGPLALAALGALAMPLCAQEQPSPPASPRRPADVPLWNVVPASRGQLSLEIQAEPPIQAALRELNKPTDLRVDGMPLDQFVEYLAKRYKIPFKLDRAALRHADIASDVPVRINAAQVPLNLALERNLQRLGLRTRFVDGVTIITVDPPPGEKRAPAEPFPAFVRRRLRSKADFQVEIMSLQKFARFLSLKYEIPFKLDLSGLERANVDPSAPVSANVKGLPLIVALQQILGRYRLAPRVVGDVVLISDNLTNRDAARLRAAKRALALPPVLRPGFAAERFRAAGRPQLAVMLKPLIEAELLFVKKVCTPSKEELGQIRKDAEAYIDSTSPGTVSTASNFVRASFHEVLDKHLSRAKAELYRAECEKRKTFERQACVHTLVAQLDRDLCLSTAQREAISKSLAAKWDDSWDALIELVAVEGTRLLPQIPDDLIEPHLESPQLEIWINLPKIGSMNWRFQSPNLTIMSIPVPEWEDD